MSTGFEGYLAVGSIILLLAAFLWRALGRHITVNNNNHPVANASATASDDGDRGREQASPLRAGLVVRGLIVVMVGAIVIAALNNHAAEVPMPTKAAVTLIAPVAVDDYVPVALPQVNSGFDFGPLFLLAGLAIVTIGPLYLISRRTNVGSQIARVRPIGHSAPSGLSAPLFDEAMRRVKESNEDERKARSYGTD